MNKSVAKYTIFCILILCAMKVVAHKYFFTTSELSFDLEQSNLELVVETITHDLEYALTHYFDTQANFDSDVGLNQLRQYVLSKIQAKYDNKKIQLNYVGEEVDHKTSRIFIEVKILDFKAERLTINNQLFFDVYPKQINLVNVDLFGMKSTLSFQRNSRYLNVSD